MHMISQKLTRLSWKVVHNLLGNTCRYCSENQKRNWRILWKNIPGEWYSNLSVFQTGKHPNTDWMTFVQSEIDLRPATIKRWWKDLKEKKVVFDERYIPERHKILGGDLAAAHFIVHRGGGVRFFKDHHWIRQDENEEYDLPKFYDPAYCIEAIDASKMVIHFEGFGNLMDLHKIKWLSLEGCPNVDDWCLDRISGTFRESLEYLDVRNCPKITARGLATLYRLSKLQKLLISNDAGDPNVEMVCLMLEDIFPELEIEGVKYIQLPDSPENPKEDGENKQALP